jgi:hypothetical protein
VADADAGEQLLHGGAAGGALVVAAGAQPVGDRGLLAVQAADGEADGDALDAGVHDATA